MNPEQIKLIKQLQDITEVTLNLNCNFYLHIQQL